jgi:hypothetical protein
MGEVVEQMIAAARPWKAARIATSLRGIQCPPSEAVRFTAPDRRMAEAVAGVRPASAATWRLAIEMLAQSHRARSRCPGCGHGDPDGVEGPPLPFGHEGPCNR